MGLPGAGKTTLANELAKLIKAKRLNADEIRKAADDWDFSEEGRIRQSKRMAENAIKLKLTEIKSSSVHIITIMIFFRLMTIPIMPIAKIIAARDKYD